MVSAYERYFCLQTNGRLLLHKFEFHIYLHLLIHKTWLSWFCVWIWQREKNERGNTSHVTCLNNTCKVEFYVYKLVIPFINRIQSIQYTLLLFGIKTSVFYKKNRCMRFDLIWFEYLQYLILKFNVTFFHVIYFGSNRIDEKSAGTRILYRGLCFRCFSPPSNYKPSLNKTAKIWWLSYSKWVPSVILFKNLSIMNLCYKSSVIFAYLMFSLFTIMFTFMLNLDNIIVIACQYPT